MGERRPKRCPHFPLLNTMDNGAHTRMKSCMAAIACVLFCLVAVCHAHEGAPVCGAAGAIVAVEVSPISLKAQFRCGAGFSILAPPLYSGDVYGHHGCISPVKLSSRLPGAQVIRTSKIHNLHTFSVKALPKAKSQLLYYMCTSSDRKGACKVVINVPVATAVKKYTRASGTPPEQEFPLCWKPGDTVISYMSRTTRRAFFRCGTELSELDPPVQSGRVYTNRTGSPAVPLAALAPGVLVNLTPHDSFYVLALYRLPKSTFSSYFYRCVSPVSNRQACTVNIVVPPIQPPSSAARALIPAASAESTQGGGPGQGIQSEKVFGKSVRTCTVPKTAVMSPLSPHSLSAQFTCAADLFLLDPPVLSGSVYVNKSCSHSVRLGSLWGASLHVSPGFPPVYILRVKALPPRKPQALFYRCTSPQTGEACLVEIKVPRALDRAADRQPAKDTPSIPICSKVHGSVDVDVDIDTKTAKFKCSDSFVALHPPVMSGKAYITRSCKVPVSVQDYVGGGIRLSETSRNFFTVSLLELPEAEPKRLYFLCKQLSEERACRVTINVPRKVLPRPNGFDARNKKLHVCRAGPDAVIRVTLHAYEALRVKCAPGLTIQPHNFEEVFDNSDGGCSGLSTLHNLLPGAQLFPTSKGVSNPLSRSDLVFLVDKLPQTDKELCYHCAPSASAKAHGCKILISVPGRVTASNISMYEKMLTHQSSGSRTSSGMSSLTLLGTIITLVGAAKPMNAVF